MNMVDLNKKIFSNFYAEIHGNVSCRFHAYINTTDDDKSFIKRVKPPLIFQSLGLKIALISTANNESFLALIGGFEFSDLPTEMHLQRLDEDAGILTVLAGHHALGYKKAYLIDDLDLPTINANEPGSKDNLVGLHADDVRPIFEDFSFYKIEQLPFDPFDGGEDRFLLLMLLILGIGAAGKLALKTKLLEIVLHLEGFPHHLLHSAYVSQTWQYSYVDAYRCIELLYPIPRMKDLRDRITARVGTTGSNMLAMDLFEDVNQATGWREIEQSGLEKLVNECSDETLFTAFSLLSSVKLVKAADTEIIKELTKTELMKVGVLRDVITLIRDKLTSLPEADLKLVSNYKRKKSAALIASALYKIRNQLVHYRNPKSILIGREIEVAFEVLVMLLLDVYRVHHTEACVDI